MELKCKNDIERKIIAKEGLLGEMLNTIIAVYKLYGAIYGEEIQNCFVTGVAYGLYAAGISIAMFRRLPFSVAKKGSTSFTAIIIALANFDTFFYDSNPIQECIQ